jgi:hypothetical protein
MVCRIAFNIWDFANVADWFAGVHMQFMNGCGSHDLICHIIFGSRYADRGVTPRSDGLSHVEGYGGWEAVIPCRRIAIKLAVRDALVLSASSVPPKQR